MKKKSTLILSSAAALALALSACGTGSSNSSKLSDVNYSMNGATAQPSVSFATPFAASDAEAYKISDGEGETIKDGDTLLVDATVFNGADTSALDSTYASNPMIIPVGESLKTAAPELYEILVDSKVGVSFSYTTNIDATSTATASATPTVSPGTATNVEVYTVSGKLLKSAEGQAKEKKSTALESFSLTDDGTATLKLAEDRGDAPTELYTEDLITGNGPAITETDTVYVNYVGATWSDGAEFDGNYGKTPAGLSLSQVIEGWKKGLAGKTVGSRVLLIIPSELAYGEDAASSGAPEGALVFVVDIVGSAPSRAEASPSATAESAPASAEATSTESESAEASASASE
ncbi:FKBP-type peptidyl-prolyl cis-trans isomerase [Rothia sp. P5766]|uniref:FKBP-type peptidyl-prolyl cis-trans isomerase n=1 Tax=unclassified Rothia (in: high G+C Gram-positive bacteria) TaxID=2689056 RepID=UPI003AC3C369